MPDYSDFIKDLRHQSIQYDSLFENEVADALEAQAIRIAELEAIINYCIKIADEHEGCKISHIEGIPCEAGEQISDKIRTALNKVAR